MSIYKSIALVMKDVGPIAKERTNQQQGFKFRSIDQVYNSLNYCMSKYEIFTVPKVLERISSERLTKNNTINFHVVLKVEYSFFHADGSFITATVFGEATDTGDKATTKALSFAHKYALLQVFCIPTEDEESKDADFHTPEETVSKEKKVGLLGAINENVKIVAQSQVKTSDDDEKIERNKMIQEIMGYFKGPVKGKFINGIQKGKKLNSYTTEELRDFEAQIFEIYAERDAEKKEENKSNEQPKFTSDEIPF